MNTRTYTCMFK